jgi:hypothetical protein
MTVKVVGQVLNRTIRIMAFSNRMVDIVVYRNKQKNLCFSHHHVGFFDVRKIVKQTFHIQTITSVRSLKWGSMAMNTITKQVGKSP